MVLAVREDRPAEAAVTTNAAANGDSAAIPRGTAAKAANLAMVFAADHVDWTLMYIGMCFEARRT